MPDPLLALAWGLLLVSAAVTIEGARRVITACSIDTTMFMTQIQKLLAADNRDRAMKLSRAVDGVVVVDLVRYALELRLPLADPAATSGDGYRDAGTQRDLVERARDALRARRVALLAGPTRWLLVAVAGAAVFTGEAAVVGWTGMIPLAVLGAGCALVWLAALFALLRRRTAALGSAAIVEQMGPAVMSDAA